MDLIKRVIYTRQQFEAFLILIGYVKQYDEYEIKEYLSQITELDSTIKVWELAKSKIIVLTDSSSFTCKIRNHPEANHILNIKQHNSFNLRIFNNIVNRINNFYDVTKTKQTL